MDRCFHQTGLSILPYVGKKYGAGDIYILNGIPRVQILGTSIFVTLFICEFMKERRLTFYGALMAVTALAAGNSAYVLGIFAFVVFYYGPVLLKWIKRNTGN